MGMSLNRVTSCSVVVPQAAKRCRATWKSLNLKDTSRTLDQLWLCQGQNPTSLISFRVKTEKQDLQPSQPQTLLEFEIYLLKKHNEYA